MYVVLKKTFLSVTNLFIERAQMLDNALQNETGGGGIGRKFCGPYIAADEVVAAMMAVGFGGEGQTGLGE
jgi:hypothetical protein